MDSDTGSPSSIAARNAEQKALAAELFARMAKKRAPYAEHTNSARREKSSDRGGNDSGDGGKSTAGQANHSTRRAGELGPPRKKLGQPSYLRERWRKKLAGPGKGWDGAAICRGRGVNGPARPATSLKGPATPGPPKESRNRPDENRPAPEPEQPDEQATIHASDPHNDAELREWKKRNAESMKILEKTTKEIPLR